MIYTKYRTLNGVKHECRFCVIRKVIILWFNLDVLEYRRTWMENIIQFSWQRTTNSLCLHGKTALDVSRNLMVISSFVNQVYDHYVNRLSKRNIFINFCHQNKTSSAFFIFLLKDLQILLIKRDMAVVFMDR